MAATVTFQDEITIHELQGRVYSTIAKAGLAVIEVSKRCAVGTRAQVHQFQILLRLRNLSTLSLELVDLWHNPKIASLVEAKPVEVRNMAASLKELTPQVDDLIARVNQSRISGHWLKLYQPYLDKFATTCRGMQGETPTSRRAWACGHGSYQRHSIGYCVINIRVLHGS